MYRIHLTYHAALIHTRRPGTTSLEESGTVIRSLFVIVAMVLCVYGSAFANDSTKAKLDSCISYYQDGEYRKAVDSLNALLPLIADLVEEAEAYKYLGFSYVMLDMIDKAKDFFRVALEKFPQMVIDTLEVPPSITVVFKQTQLETKMASGEILDKSVQKRNEKRVIVATVFSATGALSTGVGGNFLYRGYKSYHHYKGITADEPDYRNELYFWARKYWNETILGGAVTSFGAINLVISAYLFFKKEEPKKISLYSEPGSVGLVWQF
jgi:tetratricopeptide (TPR) repeat protein